MAPINTKFAIHLELLNNTLPKRIAPHLFSNFSNIKKRLDKAKDTSEVARQIYQETLPSLVESLVVESEIRLPIKKLFYLLLTLQSIIERPKEAPLDEEFAIQVQEAVNSSIISYFEEHYVPKN